MRLGILADTHGLLRPEVLSALVGVDGILHAGDVGRAHILTELEKVAPVTAIRGNIDVRGECAHLPAVEFVSIPGANLYIIHDVHELDLDPIAADVACVLSGHSHQPSIAWNKGVLYFNPGSAGPRRFALPVSLGFLEITDQGLAPKLLTLL